MKESTDPLGYLLWYRVTGCELDYAAAEGLLKKDGVLPAKPVPIDVFRRITGQGTTGRYALPTFNLELSIAVAKAPNDSMLVRHIVGTVVDGEGVTQMVRKVGDVVFHKPPRGKPSKARMRVSLEVGQEEWQEAVAAYVKILKHRYTTGVAGTLDVQAIRRIVRNCLAGAGALYLDGPYFVLDTERLAPLRRLFELLGEDCFMHSVPLPDAQEHRGLLARGIERAVAADTAVDENIWTRLEESG